MSGIADQLSAIYDTKLALSAYLEERGASVPEKFVDYGDAIWESTKDSCDWTKLSEIPRVWPQVSALVEPPEYDNPYTGICRYAYDILSARYEVSAAMLNLCLEPPPSFSAYSQTVTESKCKLPQYILDSITTAYEGMFSTFNTPYLSDSCFTNLNLNAIGTFRNNKSISGYLSFPNAKNLNGSSFAFCSNVSALNLSAVTACQGNALASCSALTELNLDSLKRIDNTSPFYGSFDKTLPSLSSLRLPSITLTYLNNKSTVQNIDFGIFGWVTGTGETRQFTNIMDLYLPNLTMTQITGISNYNCVGLASGCRIHAKDHTFLYGTQEVVDASTERAVKPRRRKTTSAKSKAAK